MSYLLDTCVVSELRKPSPDPGLMEWFESVPEYLLWLSGITLGELGYGIDRLPAGRMRNDLDVWYEELRGSFARQTVGSTPEAFVRWGELRARQEARGRTLPLIDGLLAATAIENGLTLVTRNTADFALFGVELLNPWRAEGH